MTPNREEAMKLFLEFNQTERTLKHALAVEATMRHFAKKYNEDVEKWGVIGLVHDLDFEKFPEQHCKKTREILEGRGWPAEYIRAIISHGWGAAIDVEPQLQMEKVLFAIDELTGLIAATALVRPSKKIDEVEVKSVKKKWKQAGFAAGVDRSVIELGAKMMGVEVDLLIQDVIDAMKSVAPDLGLAGVT